MTDALHAAARNDVSPRYSFGLISHVGETVPERALGLTVANSTVTRFGYETAIVIERYDRARVAGAIVRVHQEDMCQAHGLSPTRKYENERGPGVRKIIDLLRRVVPMKTFRTS